MIPADQAGFDATRDNPGGGYLATMLAERDALEQALATGAIEPHYQPIVDLRTGAATGLEALARWRHPERGLLESGEFLPVAQAAGLTGAVGERILARATREAARLVDAAGIPAHLDLHVNLSGHELRSPDLPRLIDRCLAAANLPPERLVLEVAEARLADLGMTATLRVLRSQGVRLAIDDFGAGSTPFSRLVEIDAAAIKIDRSFLARLTRDRVGESLLRGVVGVARTLDVAVIAVGVEDAAQRAALIDAGCHLGQGFLFSRPVPLDVLGRYLAVAPRGTTPAVPRRWRVSW